MVAVVILYLSFNHYSIHCNRLTQCHCRFFSLQKQAISVQTCMVAFEGQLQKSCSVLLAKLYLALWNDKVQQDFLKMLGDNSTLACIFLNLITSQRYHILIFHNHQTEFHNTNLKGNKIYLSQSESFFLKITPLRKKSKQENPWKEKNDNLLDDGKISWQFKFKQIHFELSSFPMFVNKIIRLQDNNIHDQHEYQHAL